MKMLLPASLPGCVPLAAAASVILTGLLTCLALDAEAKPRLALFPSGDEKAGAIVVLMEAALSKDGQVDLLDRANVSRVLTEQNISLASGCSADEAVKVGALLECDVLAEMRHNKLAAGGGTFEIALNVFSVKTGARLANTPFDSSDSLEHLAELAASNLVMAVRKDQAVKGASGGWTLCIMESRNVDLPREWGYVPAMIASLLDRKLLQSPSITVLERERLEQINKEANLTEDQRASLLVSSLLLSIEVSRTAAKDGIKISVFLENPAGTTTARVETSGVVGQAEALALELARKIAAQIHAAAPEVLGNNHFAEAKLFLAKVQYLKDRCDLMTNAPPEMLEALRAAYETVISLSEAALAERPENVEVQRTLTDTLIAQLDLLMGSDHEAALSSLEQLLTLKTFLERNRCWWFDSKFRTLRTNWSGRSADVEARFDALRKRDRDWQAPRRFNFAPGEAWMSSSDELVDQWKPLSALPDCYADWKGTRDGYCFYGEPPPGADVHTRHHRNVDPVVTDFVKGLSSEGKRTLLGLLEKWTESTAGLGGRSTNRRDRSLSHLYSSTDDDGKSFPLLASLAAVDLVLSSPETFADNHRMAIAHLRRGIEITTNRNDLAAFDSICGHLKEGPSLNLPLAVLESEFMPVVRLRESKGMGSPLLLWFLANEALKMKDTEEEAACLQLAFAQAKQPGLSGFGTETERSDFMGWIEEWHKSSFGKGLPDFVPKGAPLPAPQVATSVPNEFVSRKLIFRVEPTAKTRIISARLYTNLLYLLVQRGSESLNLYGINPSTWQLQFSTESRTNSIPTDTIQWDDQQVLVPLASGLLMLPLSGEAPRVLEKDDQWPAEAVTCGLEIGGHLYLGLSRGNDGYLARCNSDGTGWEILAASSRKERKSGLDDCQPYVIIGMAYNRTTDTLWLTVLSPPPVASGYFWRIRKLQPWMLKGKIWTMNVASSNIQPLVLNTGGQPTPMECRGSWAYPMPQDDGSWLFTMMRNNYFHWDNLRIDEAWTTQKVISSWSRSNCQNFDYLGDFLVEDVIRHAPVAPDFSPLGQGVVIQVRDRSFHKYARVAPPELDGQPPLFFRKVGEKLLFVTQSSLWSVDSCDPWFKHFMEESP